MEAIAGPLLFSEQSARDSQDLGDEISTSGSFLIGLETCFDPRGFQAQACGLRSGGVKVRGGTTLEDRFCNQGLLLAEQSRAGGCQVCGSGDSSISSIYH